MGIYIADFGLAHYKGTYAKVTTQNFRPPEAKGPMEYDNSNPFSLGVMMWKLLMPEHCYPWATEDDDCNSSTKIYFE